MDAALWRQLGYPRRLRDGSIAVRSGLFGDRYRLQPDQFERYASGYARPWHIDVLRDLGFVVGALFLFVLPDGAGLPVCFVCGGAGLLNWAVKTHERAIRFAAEFRPLRQVEVHDHPWSGYELCVMAHRNRLAPVWGTYFLLLGWRTADIFPHSLMQFAPFLGWPAYAVLAAICFAGAGALLVMRAYYRITRGYRLSPENIVRTEAGASFANVP